jgi:chromosome segregation ATPase
LKDLIISFINIYFPSVINKNRNNSDLLILFSKCLIKSFYYQKIIYNDFSFLNEEYKKSKKAIKRNLNLVEKKYDDIKNQKEEFLILKNELEEKMKYLNDNINNNFYEDLSPEEKEYITLNQRLDELNIKKKKIKYDFIKYENEINYNLEKLSFKIEQLKANNKLLRKNILTCQEEIKLKNHQYKLEINKLEKSIKDKFNVIKGQIAVYKKKYGDNMELYNKFVSRINETLKETGKENEKENELNTKNNYLSNSNSLYNTQSTFYKSSEKQNLRKRIFTPEKIKINN